MSIGTLITQGTGTDTERTWGPSGNVAAISHGATKAKAPPWRLGRECGPAAPGFQSPGDQSYERYVPVSASHSWWVLVIQLSEMGSAPCPSPPHGGQDSSCQLLPGGHLG